jgi:hypothetical protein
VDNTSSYGLHKFPGLYIPLVILQVLWGGGPCEVDTVLPILVCKHNGNSNNFQFNVRSEAVRSGVHLCSQSLTSALGEAQERQVNKSTMNVTKVQQLTAKPLGPQIFTVYVCVCEVQH